MKSVHEVELIATGIHGDAIEIDIYDSGKVVAFGTQELTVVPESIEAHRYDDVAKVAIVIRFHRMA